MKIRDRIVNILKQEGELTSKEISSKLIEQNKNLKDASIRGILSYLVKSEVVDSRKDQTDNQMRYSLFKNSKKENMVTKTVEKEQREELVTAKDFLDSYVELKIELQDVKRRLEEAIEKRKEAEEENKNLIEKIKILRYQTTNGGVSVKDLKSVMEK